MRSQIKTVFHHIFKRLKVRQKMLSCASYFQLFSLFRNVVKHGLSYLTYYMNVKMKELLETLFYSHDDRQILLNRQDGSSRRISVIAAEISLIILLTWYLLSESCNTFSKLSIIPCSLLSSEEELLIWSKSSWNKNNRTVTESKWNLTTVIISLYYSENLRVRTYWLNASKKYTRAWLVKHDQADSYMWVTVKLWQKM